MPTSLRKYFPYLILFCIPLFFINVHDVHAWGDDFSQYIKEALNIAHGRPYYESNYIFNKYNTIYAPPQYPPGFPILLAPVVKIWGLSFRAMFYFNSFLAACLLFVLFIYFTNRSAKPLTAICLSVLITYNGYILDLKGNVLADIPCMLFTTLYLAYREAASYSWKRILLLIFFCVMAIQIRSQAIFLLGAEGLFLLISTIRTIVRERRFSVRMLFTSPSIFVVSGTILVHLILSRVVFATPLDTISFYNAFMERVMEQNVISTGRDYAEYLVKTIAGYFHYDNYNGLFKAAIYFIECAGLVTCITGFIVKISERFITDDVFFVVMCLVIVYYPVQDPRYFLPALPIVFYYCATAISRITSAMSHIDKRKFAIIFTTTYLVLGINNIKKISIAPPPGCFPTELDKKAYKYISDSVNDKDIIVFTRPRLLTLFTNKKSMIMTWYKSPEYNKRIFDSMQVKYMLVTHGYLDEFAGTYFSTAQRPIDSVEIAYGYTLYSLR